MNIFDFIYIVGYHSGKNNGFSDSPDLYGKIYLIGVLFFLYMSSLNILHILGFNSLVAVKNIIFLFVVLGLIFIFVFLIYNQKRTRRVTAEIIIREKRIRICFNIILALSLLLLFVTTVSVGPQV